MEDSSTALKGSDKFVYGDEKMFVMHPLEQVILFLLGPKFNIINWIQVAIFIFHVHLGDPFLEAAVQVH